MVKLVKLVKLMILILGLPFEESLLFLGSQSMLCQGALLLSHQALGDCQALKIGSAFPQNMPFDVKKHMENWINTYFHTIFRGLFTSIYYPS